MSVPFSNTHLRVPRGFSTILEGLAREVLRDQPEDIPKYAAQYFDTLLKQREESGMDPAEWAAKLEDRFYNTDAFKAAEASPDKEPSTEVTISKGEKKGQDGKTRAAGRQSQVSEREKSYESQTEDESSPLAEKSNLSTTLPNVSEHVDSTENTGEEEEHEITEKHIISAEKVLPEEESVNKLPAAGVQPDEPTKTEEEKDPVITTFDQVDRGANKNGSRFVSDLDIPQYEPTDLSTFQEISNVEVCAQEFGAAEVEGGDKQETAVADKDTVDSRQEQTKAEESVEVFPYSGLADVDVCATELVGSELTKEEAPAEDNTQAITGESSKPQLEETVVPSLLSHSENTEGDQQVAEEQAEKTTEKEGAETETSSVEIHENSTHIEGFLGSKVIPKENSLVEISFEDVPEAQQIKEAEEKQPEEEDPVEAKILELQQEEDYQEVTAVAAEQKTSHKPDPDGPEMMEVEKIVNSEDEEKESQHEVSDIINEKMETNHSNLNDSEDHERGESFKTIISSHQPTSEADQENPEEETEHSNENTEKTSEADFHQDDSDVPGIKEEKTTDTVGGDKEDICTEGFSKVEDQEMNDGGAENHSSQVTQSYMSTAAMEAESETLMPWHLSEEKEESQRTLVESQPEDTVVEKEVTLKEKASEAGGLVEKGKTDSGIQEKSDAMCEESCISPTQSADLPTVDHQGEERPLGSEKDTAEPEGDSGNKQEDCSRPQEEEDIMDIPLDDPEANRAAAKIQAGFRGHMTRKKMKPEDKTEGEEVSSTGDVLNGSQGDTETGGSGPVEGEDTSVPEQ